MSISCADLKGLRHFKQIRLVAGEKGLYRQISWPFICTTSTISQWLHGGELLFISGAGLDCGEESLLSLMRESVSKLHPRDSPLAGRAGRRVLLPAL